MSLVAANRLLEKLSATKDITPDAVVAALREALESVGVSAEAAAKVALVQNLMEKSGVSPADLAKVTFLQKSLLDGGGDADKIAASINQVLDPRDKNLVNLLASAAVALGDSGVTVSSTTLQHLKECVEAAASKSSSHTRGHQCGVPKSPGSL